MESTTYSFLFDESSTYFSNYTGLYDEVTYSGGTREFLDPQNVTGSLKTQLKMYDIMIPLLGIFIIATNFAVVISSGLILRKGQQPRGTYLLLGNVAMADLITGVGVVFGQAFPVSKRNHFTCSIMLGLIVSSTLASIYSVALIAVDRFLYILHGLRYQRWVYPTRVRSMIGATWVLGILVGFLPMMGWSGDTKNGRICWFIMLAPPELIVLTTVVGFIPLVIVCVLYSIILYHAIKKVMQIRKMGKITQEDMKNPSKLRAFKGGRAVNQPEKISTITLHQVPLDNNDIVESPSQDEIKPPVKNKFLSFVINLKKGRDISNEQSLETQPNNPTKWKAIKVVLYTMGSFVLTWVPYFLACTLYVFCDSEKTPERCQKLKFAIASPLAILGFVNSLLNPIIYAWWHNGFRKSIKNLCCRNRGKQNVSQSSERKTDTSKSSQTISSQVFTTTSESNINETQLK